MKWAILNHYRTSLPRLERIKATYRPLFLDIHRTVRRCWPNQGIPQHRPHLSWSGAGDGDCQPLPCILLQCCGELNTFNNDLNIDLCLVQVSWAIWYLVSSLSSNMEWTRCGHEYNTENCWSQELRDVIMISFMDG